MGDEYRDDRGHFSTKEQDGGPCRHFDVKSHNESIRRSNYGQRKERTQEFLNGLEKEGWQVRKRDDGSVISAKGTVDVGGGKKADVEVSESQGMAEARYSMPGANHYVFSSQEEVESAMEAEERRKQFVKERDLEKIKGMGLSDSDFQEAQKAIMGGGEYAMFDDMVVTYENVPKYPIRKTTEYSKGGKKEEYEGDRFFDDRLPSDFWSNPPTTKEGWLRKYAEMNDAIEKADSEISEFSKRGASEKLESVKRGDYPKGYFSDDPITSGGQVGGYIGNSQSRSAAYSKGKGSMPLTLWNKEKFLDFVGQDEKMREFLPEIKKIPFAEIKKNLLYEDGWHHTGYKFDKTPFYGIKSEQDIIEYLSGGLGKGLMKGLGQ